MMGERQQFRAEHITNNGTFRTTRIIWKGIIIIPWGEKNNYSSRNQLNRNIKTSSKKYKELIGFRGNMQQELLRA